MRQEQTLRQNYCDAIAGGQKQNAEHVAQITRLSVYVVLFALLHFHKSLNILHILHQFEHFRLLDMNVSVNIRFNFYVCVYTLNI